MVVAETTESEADITSESDVEEFEPIESTAFKKGKIEGNVYTSEYAGIKFTLPEGMEFMDGPELEDLFSRLSKPQQVRIRSSLWQR